MSFGKSSPAYQPITRAMLPFLASHFSRVPSLALESVFGILTYRLRTETLQFVSLADKLDRYLGGERDDASFGFGAGIRLSAIAKDNTHKAQSSIMELFHDVVVEAPMAGDNERRLQAYLAKEFGVTLARYHSCGDAIVDLGQLDAFYDSTGPEQELRTTLDWNAVTRKNVPVAELLATYQYSSQDASSTERAYSIALELVDVEAEKILTA